MPVPGGKKIVSRSPENHHPKDFGSLDFWFVDLMTAVDLMMAVDLKAESA